VLLGAKVARQCPLIARVGASRPDCVNEYSVASQTYRVITFEAHLVDGVGNVITAIQELRRKKHVAQHKHGPRGQFAVQRNGSAVYATLRPVSTVCYLPQAILIQTHRVACGVVELDRIVGRRTFHVL
jgi:hypothetical protein